MMLVTARNPSRKLTSVVDWRWMGPLLSTPMATIVMIVATKMLVNAASD